MSLFQLQSKEWRDGAQHRAKIVIDGELLVIAEAYRYCAVRAVDSVVSQYICPLKRLAIDLRSMVIGDRLSLSLKPRHDIKPVNN